MAVLIKHQLTQLYFSYVHSHFYSDKTVQICWFPSQHLTHVFLSQKPATSMILMLLAFYCSARYLRTSYVLHVLFIVPFFLSITPALFFLYSYSLLPFTVIMRLNFKIKVEYLSPPLPVRNIQFLCV